MQAVKSFAAEKDVGTAATAQEVSPGSARYAIRRAVTLQSLAGRLAARRPLVRRNRSHGGVGHPGDEHADRRRRDQQSTSSPGLLRHRVSRAAGWT
jgi:hypothetical protein